jgi:hypothetical protein
MLCSEKTFAMYVVNDRLAFRYKELQVEKRTQMFPRNNTKAAFKHI